jgi:exosortase E/protease (VPEID-CTERM system)
MALMLAFSSAWLLFFRREFRFPQSLLLIPAGMVVMWLSNAIRITVLILIGVAGAPGVALGGFHSQAGWIAFNCVALGFALYTRQMPWFAAGSNDKTKEHNPTAAYLMPFLVILAAGMVSHAVAGEFEWLYPLRFAAGVVTLWFFRAKYREFDWRVGWSAILTGIAVFGIWIGLDLLAPTGNHNGIESALASSPGFFRISWLVFRTAAAVITVPLAEELAFRGFLIRRLISPHFESLDFKRYTISSVVLSSVAFGLLHGDRWIAGTLAGLLYSAVFLRLGRIGEAVAAHATTNALIACCVLFGGKWYLW